MAYAVSAELPLDEVEEVRSYMGEVSGSEIIVGRDVRIEILKGDIRERRGRAMLIFRYQHRGGF